MNAPVWGITYRYLAGRGGVGCAPPRARRHVGTQAGARGQTPVGDARYLGAVPRQNSVSGGL